MSLSRIIHHSHSFTRLETYHHIYFKKIKVKKSLVQKGAEIERTGNFINFKICWKTIPSVRAEGEGWIISGTQNTHL